MANGVSAYLVVRQHDGFGEVHPLAKSGRFTIGRSAGTSIPLRDEMCSRVHSEVFFTSGRWYLRDNQSLNGTRVNNLQVRDDYALQPLDEISLGRSVLVFVEDLSQLPNLPPGVEPAQRPDDTLEIKKRLNQTRYLDQPAVVTDRTLPSSPVSPRPGTGRRRLLPRGVLRVRGWRRLATASG